MSMLVMLLLSSLPPFDNPRRLLVLDDAAASLEAFADEKQIAEKIRTRVDADVVVFIFVRSIDRRLCIYIVALLAIIL